MGGGTEVREAVPGEVMVMAFMGWGDIVVVVSGLRVWLGRMGRKAGW